MSNLSKILVQAGVVSADSLQEFVRWGLPVPERVEQSGNPLLADKSITLQSFLEAMDHALEDQGYTLLRETELDVLQRFLATMRPAVLHLFAETSRDVLIRTMIGKQYTGEYIIPWSADSIVAWLTNGETYLEIEDEAPIYFSAVREAFYGENKAFVVCTPAKAVS